MPDDYSADFSTSGSVSAGGAATGVIDTAYDRDWFAAILQAGRTYEISLEGTPTGGGTLTDTYLDGIYNASGYYISGTSNDDGGVGYNSFLEYTATTGGVHYISAAAYGSNTGSYTLSLVDLSGADDYSDATDTSGSVTAGGSATGEIETEYDNDWFALSVTAGTTYVIDLEGSETGRGSLSDPYLIGVYDSGGAYLPNSYNDDGGEGLNSRLEFTPSASGTVYVSAGAYGANTGSYTLSVEGAAASDDYSEDAGRAGRVAVGGDTTGEIEDPYDGDWFEVSLTAGQTYQIDLEGAETGSGSLSDPYILGVYGPDSAYIPDTYNDDGGEGLNSRLEFTPTASGSYYISAGAYSANTGTYTLSVSGAGAGDDYPDNPGTLGSVSPGSDTSGEIEDPYDRDWFAVTLEGGQSYQIDLQGSGTGGGSLSDTYLNGIYDAAGSYMFDTYNDDGGEGLNSRVEFSPVSSGTYFISAGAYGANTGSYTLSVSGAGSFDDYAADTSTTGAVSDSGIAMGEIEAPGDRDWFEVTLAPGATYSIGLEGSWSESGTLSDPYLRGIYNASGTLIPGTSDDDGGLVLDSLTQYTAGSGGTYYISAGAFGDATGTYTLVVENLGGGSGDDFAADTGTTGSVSVGGSVTGEIEEAYDADWFAVSVSSGGSYVIELEGTPTGAGTLPDPYIDGIYDADGDYIPYSYNDDGGIGLNSRLEFTADAGGTYYISAAAYGLNTGTYTLSVDAAGGGGAADDYAASTSTDGTVSVGGSSTGVIEESGDRDWFAVSLAAGTSYTFDLEGSRTDAGTLSDPYIRGLYDSSGTLISGTADDDGGEGLNSQMSYSVGSSGTYYIAAGAFGSNTGSYKVSVSAGGAADDYSQSTGTSGAVAVDGSTTGEIESSGDRDWFAVSLTAGSTYLIDLEGMETGGGSLSDPYFRGVYDSSGAAIGGTSDDDGGEGLNSQVLFTASSGGTHYLSAGAYSNHTGSYKLSIEEVATSAPTDDYSQSTDTSGAVAVGGSATGEIEEAGDHDWFAVSLEAGQTVRIDVEGSETEAGTLADPYLRGVHNSAGTIIAGTTNDDGGEGLNSQLEFTAGDAGTYYIAAGAYDGTGSYKVTVSEVAGGGGGGGGGGGDAGDYDITIAYSGDPAYNAVFEAAAATWESIITDDVPDVIDATLGAVDDLRIEASVTDIDGPGNILGQAGPRAFREGSSLPYSGMMQFDSADLAGMEAKGILQDVIEHEMGHVLGLGTLWSWLGLRSGFEYTGANAVAEYSTLTGSTESFVPLESSGGPGTAGSHWSEDIFGNELMTGYAENSPPMPLSRLTVGGLEDLGYEVDYGEAEAYSISGSASLALDDLVLSLVSADGGPLSDIAGSSDLTADEFAGARLVNYEDKPLTITDTPDAQKLDGDVTTADEDTIFFFETTTGNEYFVEIIGTFEKNDPETADDVKGTITSMSFYSEGYLLVTYDFSDAPVDAEDYLGSWRPYDLDDDNYIENRSPNAQNDVIDAGDGDDVLVGGLGDDDLDGGAGDDAAVFDVDYADVEVTLAGDVFTLTSDQGTDTVTGVETFEFADRTLTASDLAEDAGEGGGGGGGGTSGETLYGTAGDDRLEGGDGDDTLIGGGGDDRLIGNGGNDRLEGGDGLDILNGGDGDDTILGGASSADRRDQIFGGDGDDTIDAGYGNDAVFGGDGNDTIAGGFGADELQGQGGNDTITGSALSDLVFGGDGDDFVNGGFGFDRINGGAGADRFYHLGIADHGSDWVQDYTAADGDVLLFGQAGASIDDFNVQFTHTSSPETGRSGDDDVQEAFVVYRPAGLIVWALVDGGGQASLNIDIGGEVFDLLA